MILNDLITFDLLEQITKRGYQKGSICESIINEEPNFIVSSDDFDIELLRFSSKELNGNIAIRDSDGSVIFINGNWAKKL
jgi:hypothetical protein